jgi:hypothetical protein
MCDHAMPSQIAEGRLPQRSALLRSLLRLQQKRRGRIAITQGWGEVEKPRDVLLLQDFISPREPLLRRRCRGTDAPPVTCILLSPFLFA